MLVRVSGDIRHELLGCKGKESFPEKLLEGVQLSVLYDLLTAVYHHIRILLFEGSNL